ncbi:hypothetical protein K0B96_12145 [Horticoccus luteus]|uniref:Uncharacterized protein n=1 Tax=Horticoccus luteus TaxID=2862869 RepID=A0A8F9TTL5_9BACT|nr:hypothetical protein [Horticoccus luteus]QYM78058.1 hypothetical protein K0B96_12145 [Horticoccus luteus]
MKLERHLGQRCWRLQNGTVDAWLTERGGQLAPVTFQLGNGKAVQPFAIAPWAEEKVAADTPQMLRVLRGDFFCAPFGGNETPWRGEKFPPHGEPANDVWKLVDGEARGEVARLHTRMDLTVRAGRVDKYITVREGHSAVYCENILSGMRGPMAIGTHPCLQFPDEPGVARVSTSAFAFGVTPPGLFEQPESGGYASLKVNARFRSLQRVPRADGEVADLSRYPARRGYEDLVMLVGPAKPRGLGWSAVTFPGEGYVFFALKDPTVLRHTVLWHSNGGRYYAPWSGRHRNVLGVEEVTAYFHYGLAASAKPNALNRAGVPTTVQLDPKQPLRVAHILAMAAVPRGFDEVKSIVPVESGVWLIARSGKRVFAPLDVDFLGAGE